MCNSTTRSAPAGRYQASPGDAEPAGRASSRESSRRGTSRPGCCHRIPAAASSASSRRDDPLVSILMFAWCTTRAIAGMELHRPDESAASSGHRDDERANGVGALAGQHVRLGHRRARDPECRTATPSRRLVPAASGAIAFERPISPPTAESARPARRSAGECRRTSHARAAASTAACSASAVTRAIREARGRASAKSSSGNGAPPPGRWQPAHFSRRSGATSRLKVTARAGARLDALGGAAGWRQLSAHADAAGPATSSDARKARKQAT